jgi:hypothetical protein
MHDAERLYGFTRKQWEEAKEEARQAIINSARKGATITYGDLASKITCISVGPHDFAIRHLLGEISTEEDATGRGMLSALVVMKEDGRPGTGFFTLAKELGRNTKNPEEFWVKECSLVFKGWGSA